MNFRRLEMLYDWLENHPVKTTRTETTTRTVTVCDLCGQDHARATCYRCGKDLCSDCVKVGRVVDLRPSQADYGRCNGPYFCAGCLEEAQERKDPVLAALRDLKEVEATFKLFKEQCFVAISKHLAYVERLVEAARERHEGEMLLPEREVLYEKAKRRSADIKSGLGN